MKPRYIPKKALLLAGASAAAMVVSAGATQAQDESNTLEEIIVTSQKRSQSVQDVPIAMSAYDAAFVERANLDDVKDLIKFTPGFAGDSKDSFVDFVNVRGISTNDFGVGGDPSIGFFKNGLYQGRQGTAVSSLYDLDRAEVLRGPQGFLFGRNAISGAISFHTKKPDYDNQSGYVEAGIGERGILEAQGAINLPISENFAIRVAGYTSHENGFIHNTALPNEEDLGGHDKTSGRISAAFKGESWDVLAIAEYEDRKTSGTVYRAILDDPAAQPWEDTFAGQQLPGPDMRTTHSDMGLGNFDIGKVLSLSAEINVDLDFATLTSVTGYKDHEYDYAEDYDGTALHHDDYFQDQEGDYFEQELRLVSNTDGPLSWYAGVSYYKENIDAFFSGGADEDAICGTYYYYYDNCNDLYTYWGYSGFTTSPEGLVETNHSVGSYHGWGAYLDLTYAVSDKLDIGVGMRYNKDTKDFAIDILPVTSDLGPWYYYGYTTDGPVNTSQSWDDFTPRFIVRYRPTDDMMLYASVTKGFKTGGFNSFGTQLVDGGPSRIPDHFDPETVWSYEMGIKGSSANDRVRYDISAYHYKYKDLQLNYWDGGTIVDNIGEAKAYGVEGTLHAILSDNFDMIFSGSYNSNKIKDANFISPGSDGNRLSGTPKTKFSGLLSYHTPITNTGELNASVEFVTQSSVYLGIGNIDYTKQDPWTDVSLRLGYEDDAGWSVTAYVENVTDDIYFDGGYEGADFAPSIMFGVSRPRTFGVKFSHKFGN